MPRAGAAALVWTAHCSQLAVAIAGCLVFAGLLTANYYVQDGTTGFLALLLASGAIGLAALRWGMGTRDAPSRLETAMAWAAIGVGAATFLVLDATATDASYKEISDGNWYRLMAQALLHNGAFIVDGQYTHHYPPLYPFVLAGFFAVLGDGIPATQFATGVMHFAAIVTVYFTTKAFYGPASALRVAALISALPMLIFFDARNSSEHLVLIIFTLTLYAIRKSIDPATRHYIIYAGALAGLGYLSKSSLGYFFIVAGLIGFAWRYYYVQARVFRDRHYMTAVAVFGAIVAVWAGRNLVRFWDGSFGGFFTAWQSSLYFQTAQKYTLGQEPLTYAAAVLVMAALSVAFFWGYLWPFGRTMLSSWNRIKEEAVSFHWVAFSTPILIALAITPVFFVYEVATQPQWFSYTPELTVRYYMIAFTRYAFIALLPAMWLIEEQRRHEAPAAQGAPAGASPGATSAS